MHDKRKARRREPTGLRACAAHQEIAAKATRT